MPYEFDRYINGKLMAEGVTIERQTNLTDAMRDAAKIASRGPNSEIPVLVLRPEAAERLAGARVVTDAMVRAFQSKYREFWKGSWPDTETSRELLTAALAEPAGEVEPVAWLRDIDGTGSLHPASKGDPGAFPVYPTPPDASAIRGAAIQLLSAIDAGCGREEIISQTGPLRSALAGAKP